METGIGLGLDPRWLSEDDGGLAMLNEGLALLTSAVMVVEGSTEDMVRERAVPRRRPPAYGEGAVFLSCRLGRGISGGGGWTQRAP